MVQLIPSSTVIEVVGTKPKLIEKYVGRVNSDTTQASLTHKNSPASWEEAGHRRNSTSSLWCWAERCWSPPEITKSMLLRAKRCSPIKTNWCAIRPQIRMAPKIWPFTYGPSALIPFTGIDRRPLPTRCAITEGRTIDRQQARL